MINNDFTKLFTENEFNVNNFNDNKTKLLQYIDVLNVYIIKVLNNGDIDDLEHRIDEPNGEPLHFNVENSENSEYFNIVKNMFLSMNKYINISDKLINILCYIIKNPSYTLNYVYTKDFTSYKVKKDIYIDSLNPIEFVIYAYYYNLIYNIKDY